MGEVVHSKGDVYHVECAVNGSNYGTPDGPKFPLIPTFVETILSIIESLVYHVKKY